MTAKVSSALDGALNSLKNIKTNEGSSGLDGTANDVDLSKLFEPDELATLVDVSTEELIECLKKSEFGQKLVETLDDKAQAVFDQLGRRYEIVGKKYTASFRTHSRRWGTGIAFVLALVFNIDSIYIADSYVKNESIRQSVIAQQDLVVKNYENMAKTAEKGDSATGEEVAEEFEKSKQRLKDLTSVGLPIGWSYFPHSKLRPGPAPTALDGKNGFEDARDLRDPKDWLFWLLGIFATGLLAGLGAPFWYDAVVGISRVAKRARGAGNPAA